MFRCSFYLAVRKQADAHLVDGTGHKPHYSLRTLCRALRYVGSNPCKSVQRSLYEVGGQKRSVQERGFWVSFFSYILCVHTFGSIFLYLLMLAGLLYEFPDSAGQKFPPCCPETGVSAHPNGEHQMSQTGRIVERFLRGVTVSFTSFTPILAGERRSLKHGCICLKSAFVHFHIASSSWKTGRGVFDVMMS